ncbi:MAG: 30S ribosomal protein S7 [Candidatus Omnitrophica bacterium]|nr:30S ribosomal protein S7 [Candidatus Omnitrophota bacterium]
MRRRRVPEKKIQLDPRFKNKVVSKFINMVMLDGKKSTAQRIVYGAFELAKERLGESDALKIFSKVLDNTRPRLEVKSRRIGGATYQVPTEVRRERGIVLALRWMRNIARGRKGKSMQEKLADEIVASFRGEGAVIKKRDDLHKMAEANRAFAHFKW